MTRWIAIGSALISIGAISLVLRWGTSGRAGTPPFELAVSVLGIATPLASVLLTRHLWRRGRRRGALLSATPSLVMVLGTAIGVTWVPLSLTTLLWLDLFVLLAFLTILLLYGRSLLKPDAAPDAGATPTVREPAA